jgi:hypothetical protein
MKTVHNPLLTEPVIKFNIEQFCSHIVGSRAIKSVTQKFKHRVNDFGKFEQNIKEMFMNMLPQIVKEKEWKDIVKLLSLKEGEYIIEGEYILLTLRVVLDNNYYGLLLDSSFKPENLSNNELNLFVNDLNNKIQSKLDSDLC